MEILAHMLNAIGLLILILLFFYRFQGDIHDVQISVTGSDGFHSHKENDINGVHDHEVVVKPIFTDAYVSYEKRIKTLIFIAAVSQLIATSIFAFAT